MKLEPIVNLRRVAALMRIDLVSHKKTILIAALAAMATLLTVSAIAASTRMRFQFHQLVSFPFTLLVGGTLITSMAFSDYTDKLKGQTGLTLPASVHEKLLARFLLTLPGYTLAVFPFYFLFLFLSRILNTMLFRHAHPSIDLNDGYFQFVLYLYIVVHALFFLGSLLFSKQTFIRTLLIVSTAGAVLYFTNEIAAHLFFRNMGIIQYETIRSLLRYSFELRTTLFPVSLFIIFVCWVASLMRVREIEV